MEATTKIDGVEFTITMRDERKTTGTCWFVVHSDDAKDPTAEVTYRERDRNWGFMLSTGSGAAGGTNPWTPEKAVTEAARTILGARSRREDLERRPELTPDEVCEEMQTYLANLNG